MLYSYNNNSIGRYELTKSPLETCDTIITFVHGKDVIVKELTTHSKEKEHINTIDDILLNINNIMLAVFRFKYKEEDVTIVVDFDQKNAVVTTNSVQMNNEMHDLL